MPRYKLKKDCLFVDAYDLDEAKKHPANPPNRKEQGIPYAHIINKSVTAAKQNKKTREPEYPYTMLNDKAGFIGRFIVMGVETDLLLPQIIASEFGVSVAEAKTEVKATYDLMEDYLEEITPSEKIGPKFEKDILDGTSLTTAKKGFHSGNYELDFRVNPMGIGIFKG